jgi:phasin family protein
MIEQFEKYFTPMRDLNTLAISNVEKLLELQLKFIEDTTKTSVESLKSAITINSAESIKDYITEQVAVSKQLTERTIEDGRTVAELTNTFTTDAQSLVKETFKVAS